MSRKFFVGGNWKANPTTVKETNELIELLNKAKITANVETVICTPFIYLSLVKSKLRSDFAVGAENVFNKDKGAYTGEITPPMIKDLGVTWTIIGHSERRDILKEDDTFLASKATEALKAGLKIIYCCGEHLEERKAKKEKDFVSAQIDKLIPAISADKWDSVVIAYEPIWAIGTGVVASTADAQEMGKTIRELIAAKVNPGVAAKLRILYGGSVKSDNCKDLAAQPDVDGFLVGGASLTPSFIDIVNSPPSGK
uniref:Triosephosphate isomerase n=1 Tax=Coptotermes formosanus TaxID=36987 RepID=R4UJD5_COPFO|nr:triosephosphate isomerase [Coptotermes formosanus]